MKKNIIAIVICISVVLNIFFLYALNEFNNEINSQNNTIEVLRGENNITEEEKSSILSKYMSARVIYLTSRNSVGDNSEDADKYIAEMQYYLDHYDFIKEYELNNKESLIDELLKVN